MHNNKRILFDLQSTQPQPKAKYHGAGKYGIAVFLKLVELYPERIAVYYDDNAYIEKYVLDIISKNKITTYLSKDISIYDAAYREGGVLYVPMIGAHTFPIPPKNITLITTQHDLRHFILKRDRFYVMTDKKPFPYIRFFLFKIKDYLVGNKKRKIIFKRITDFLNSPNVLYVTVSQHSKYCFIDKCPKLDSKKIGVLWAPNTINDDINYEKIYYGKYWLLVGVNRYEKNGCRAIIAFDELFTSHPEINGRVVITGIANWSEIRIKVSNRDRFVLLGYVNESILKSLYHNAYLFVYPSLNEGFGYPPIEAMAESCPVITSSSASIPEICQDGVMYFNPYLIEEIKNRILQMEDDDIHSNYIEKAKKRYEEIRKTQDKDLISLCNLIISSVE